MADRPLTVTHSSTRQTRRVRVGPTQASNPNKSSSYPAPVNDGLQLTEEAAQRQGVGAECGAPRLVSATEVLEAAPLPVFSLATVAMKFTTTKTDTTNMAAAVGPW